MPVVVVRPMNADNMGRDIKRTPSVTIALIPSQSHPLSIPQLIRVAVVASKDKIPIQLEYRAI